MWEKDLRSAKWNFILNQVPPFVEGPETMPSLGKKKQELEEIERECHLFKLFPAKTGIWTGYWKVIYHIKIYIFGQILQMWEELESKSLLKASSLSGKYVFPDKSPTKGVQWDCFSILAIETVWEFSIALTCSHYFNPYPKGKRPSLFPTSVI